MYRARCACTKRAAQHGGYAGHHDAKLLHAGYIFARASIHFDHFANLNEQRNFNHRASRQGRRFTAGTRGVAFQARIGFNDFQLNEVRRVTAIGWPFHRVTMHSA